MEPAVVRLLRCPHCGDVLRQVEQALRCRAGHTFDVARQGYVNLLSGATRLRGDTTAMVAARETFLAAGHYTFLADAVAMACRDIAAEGCIVDVGAGTGYYLAAALNQAPERIGLAIDLSKHAARRAARAHPRIDAVVADAWGELPVMSGSAAAVLSIFGPRNPTEMRRLLHGGGALVAVVPTADHLHELVDEFDLLTVDADKQEHVDAKLASEFMPAARKSFQRQLALAAADVKALVQMGPSAWHTDETALTSRVERLTEPFHVTASCIVTVYRPR